MISISPIDISRMRFADEFFDKMQLQVEKAFAATSEREVGAIANPDENRMVGHYWLRNSKLTPIRRMVLVFRDCENPPAAWRIAYRML